MEAYLNRMAMLRLYTRSLLQLGHRQAPSFSQKWRLALLFQLPGLLNVFWRVSPPWEKQIDKTFTGRKG